MWAGSTRIAIGPDGSTSPVNGTHTSTVASASGVTAPW